MKRVALCLLLAALSLAAHADELLGSISSWKPPDHVTIRLVEHQYELYFEGRGDPETITLSPDDWHDLVAAYRKALSQRPRLKDNEERDVGDAGPITVSLLARPDLRAVLLRTQQHIIILAQPDQFDAMDHILERIDHPH